MLFQAPEINANTYGSTFKDEAKIEKSSKIQKQNFDF